MTAAPNGAAVQNAVSSAKQFTTAAAQGGSQATVLVNLVLQSCQLVHDKNSDVYAIDKVTGEVRRIEHRAFRNWLVASYYRSTNSSARSQSIAEAIQTLAGIGRHDCPMADVHIRCAARGASYIIDLGQRGNSMAVVVEPGRWDVVSSPEALFVRPESLEPLPVPVPGGDINALWDIVNIPEPARLLVLTWLIDCLRPDTPYPMLELIGEQGSAKSQTQELLRMLIDPSTLKLRSAPRTSEDVYVGAANGYMLAYDNLSYMSSDLQDTFCRVVYGVAHAGRKLYTNTEESSVIAHRPVSLNSIAACVTAQDLVDRTVSIELPMIQDRRVRGQVDAAFAAAHPVLFGALLDVFAAALDKLPWIQIEAARRPRMLEYSLLGVAVASALGMPEESFLAAYEAARAESIGRTLDASPVATALINWLEDKPGRYGEYSIKDLFGVVQGWKPQGCEAWPRSAKGFADALRRAAPALRTQGIEVSRGRKSNGQTLVAIGKTCRTKVTEVTDVTGLSGQASGQGAGQDQGGQ